MFVRYSISYVGMPGGFRTQISHKIPAQLRFLALMQTHKIYPMPLILFGSEFWGGLIDWIRNTLIEYETISEEDLDYIKVTDDTARGVDIMLEHRQWKHEKRQMGL